MNYVFIKRFGAVAAAYTTMVSYTLLFIMQWRGAKKLEPSLFQIRPFVIFTSIVCLGGVVYNYIVDLWMVRYALCFLLVVATGIYLLKNRGKMLSIFLSH